MNRKFTNIAPGKALFLFSALLAMGFVFTGCEYNDFYAPEYVIGHVHEYARGDHDGNLVSRYGAPYYFLYDDLGKVDPYNDNELLGLLPDIYLNCESSYPEYEKYHCVDCGLEIWRKTGKVCERLGHACTDWKIKDDPTCTQPGLEVITCIRDGCSYRLTRELPAKGHDIVQVERKEPTCTEEGLEAGRKCRRCHKNYDRKPIPALGHDWGEPVYERNKRVNSVKASRRCKRCNTSESEEAWLVRVDGLTDLPNISVHVARFTYPAFKDQYYFYDNLRLGWLDYCIHPKGVDEVIPAVPATCSQAGLTEGKRCAVCGAILVEQQPTPLEPHVEQVIPAVPATCSQAGLTEGKMCTICGAIIEAQQETPPTGMHTEEIIPAVPATCSNTGLTEGKKCSVCGAILVAQETTNIDPNNHDWGETVYEWKRYACTCTASCTCSLNSDHKLEVEMPATPSTTATCTEAGKKTWTAVFNEPFETQTTTEDTPALGHDWSTTYTWSDDHSTCTAERECKRCGTGQVLTVNATAVSTVATCQAPETTTYTASFADPFEPQTVTIVGELGEHIWSEWTNGGGFILATCTHHGTEWRKCMVCNTEEYRDKAALGHDWGEASYTWSNDNATCTATRVCQRDSSHVETKTVDAVEGENTATCEAGGKITYTATFDAPFETQTKTVDTLALGHDWGEWGNSTATCTSAGKETRTCSRCGATETRDVEPLGHTGGTATCTAQAVCTRCEQPYGEALGHDPVHHDAQAPTCTAPGWDAYDTCSRCDYTTYAETPAQGHDWGEWTPTKAPNCTEPGEKIHTCQRTGCGATETEPIPPVEGAHVAVVDPAVAATCVEEGKTEGSHCSVCGKVLVEQTATEKNPNNHAALKIGDDAEPATCEKNGYAGTLYCTACGTNGEDTFISEGAIIPALEHEYNDEGVCARCGKLKEQEGVSGGNS